MAHMEKMDHSCENGGKISQRGVPQTFLLTVIFNTLLVLAFSPALCKTKETELKTAVFFYMLLDTIG